MSSYLFMKQLLCLLSFVLVLHSSQAQSSATEAKAAYLLAEEAFNANEWKEALKYLEQCKAKIGTVNSKILYLQIMTEMELAKTDAAYYDAVARSINAFEKAPDAAAFNEEKTLEVMKIKVRLNNLRETAKTKEAAAAEEAIAAKYVDSVFAVYSIKPGVSLAAFNKGRMTKFDDKKGTVFFYNDKKQEGLDMVYFKNGTMWQAIYLVKKNNDPASLKQQFDAIVRAFPPGLTKQTQTINTTAEYETASVVAGKKLVTVIYAIAAKELSIQISDISYL
jgi:hypothetical protein